MIIAPPPILTGRQTTPLPKYPVLHLQVLVSVLNLEYGLQEEHCPLTVVVFGLQTHFFCSSFHYCNRPHVRQLEPTRY